MTASAWWMLGLTWAVVVAFTLRFFFKVLTLPPSGGSAGRAER